MGIIADRLDGLRVRASVADGGIRGELRGRASVEVTFAPWVCRMLDERSLERHLAALAKLLWAARMRDYFAAVSEAFGETVTREPPAAGRRDVEFVQARDRIVARGSSVDGRIAIEVLGMRAWRVTVADGTLRARELPQQVREAAEALIQDQLRQVRLLKRERGTMWRPC
jgi:hypothetical protein